MDPVKFLTGFGLGFGAIILVAAAVAACAAVACLWCRRGDDPRSEYDAITP